MRAVVDAVVDRRAKLGQRGGINPGLERPVGGRGERRGRAACVPVNPVELGRGIRVTDHGSWLAEDNRTLVRERKVMTGGVGSGCAPRRLAEPPVSSGRILQQHRGVVAGCLRYRDWPKRYSVGNGRQSDRANKGSAQVRNAFSHQRQRRQPSARQAPTDFPPKYPPW